MTKWNETTGNDASPEVAGTTSIKIEWAERASGSGMFLTTDGRLTGQKSGSNFNIGVLYVDVKPRDADEYWQPNPTTSQIERLRTLSKTIGSNQEITVTSSSEQLGSLFANFLNNNRG